MRAFLSIWQKLNNFYHFYDPLCSHVFWIKVYNKANLYQTRMFWYWQITFPFRYFNTFYQIETLKLYRLKHPCLFFIWNVKKYLMNLHYFINHDFQYSSLSLVLLFVLFNIRFEDNSLSINGNVISIRHVKHFSSGIAFQIVLIYKVCCRRIYGVIFANIMINTVKIMSPACSQTF